jgi:hypothetical protein
MIPVVKLFAHVLLVTVVLNVSTQTSADWKIATEPQKKIMANFDTPMKIVVKDRKGKPVSGATVELVVKMVDMDHGEHKWPAKMVAPGLYEGKANFFMVGTWTLETRVTKGRLSKVQTTRVEVKE